MSLRTQQLQALFARRRDQEHMRIERTAAVSQYYDHWNKVTHRFGNWTAPEYYQQADEQLKRKNDKRTKEAALEKRREKLREQLRTENATMAEELRQRTRPRAKQTTADTETLQRIRQTAMEREKLKWKLELEAKLCAKWRHGVDDDNLLFQGKSDHEVLAKLNWLDGQIEQKLIEEQKEASERETKLRLQEEFNKMAQVMKEREQLREQEIKDLRSIQEHNMNEIKIRQKETEKLAYDEKMLRQQSTSIKRELELLKESLITLQPYSDDTNVPDENFNLNKIKVALRKRCEDYRQQLNISLDILERTKSLSKTYNNDNHNNLIIQQLKDKYQQQLDEEGMAISNIEVMYDSEAKQNLKRCEDIWQNEAIKRYHEISKLLENEQANIDARLAENVAQQKEVLEMRSMHLTAIENSNEKLKQIIEEDIMPNSPKPQSPSFPMPVDSTMAAKSSELSIPKLTNSFTNLNLDVWADMPSPRARPLRKMRPTTTAAAAVSTTTKSVASDDVIRRVPLPAPPPPLPAPTFGRKRVAWN